MRANHTNFLKKIFKISLLLLVITTFSCGEYNIADKDIFQKKITVFEYFEPFYEVITTKTGFITKFTRSVTNGDSTNCEIVQSKDQRISKIGFDGKIIWEKIQSFTYQPLNFSEGTDGNFYDINYGNSVYLRKLDGNLNDISSINLNLEKKYFGLGDNFNGLTYLNNDLILGYGQTKSRTVSENNFVSKKFVCLLDVKSGVQKLYIDEEESMIGYFSKFFKTANNEFIGIFYLNGYNSNKSKIRIQKFDRNLLKLSQKEIDFPSNALINKDNVNFLNDELNIIYYANGVLNLMNINQSLDVKTNSLGLSFAYNPVFVKNETNELIYLESSSNGYSNIKKIVKNGENLTSETIVESSIDLRNSYFDNNSVYSLANTGKYNQPNITVLNSSSGNVLIKKVIYNSQYSRNCR